MISVRYLVNKFNSLADGLRQAVESGFNGRVIKDLLQPQNKQITQALPKTTPPLIVLRQRLASHCINLQKHHSLNNVLCINYN